MITTLKQFLLEKNEYSNYIQLRYKDGEYILSGQNKMIEANLLDSNGIRVDITLDNGSFIRISDDNTIYALINGDAIECYFSKDDTYSIIDFIERSSELYDYPGIKPVIIEVLNNLQIEVNESNDNIDINTLITKPLNTYNSDPNILNNISVLLKPNLTKSNNFSTELEEFTKTENNIYNQVSSKLMNVFMDEHNISEKDFKSLDDLKHKINIFKNKKEYIETVDKMNGFRPSHIAEEIFARYFANKYSVKPSTLEDPIMKGMNNVI